MILTKATKNIHLKKKHCNRFGHYSDGNSEVFLVIIQYFGSQQPQHVYGQKLKPRPGSKQEVALTMQTVLLSVPPQAHDNEDQQNEHHDTQNAAHDQVEQAARLAGCICGEKAWRGYGALAGHTWRLTG